MIEQIFNDAYDPKKPMGNADLKIVTKKKKGLRSAKPLSGSTKPDNENQQNPMDSKDNKKAHAHVPTSNV